MIRDTLVQQNLIKIEGQVTSTKYDGDCTGLGLLFEGGHVKLTSKSLTKLPAKDMTFLVWIRPRTSNQVATIFSTSISGGGRQILELRPAEGSMPNALLKWTVNTDKTSTLFTIETENIIPSGKYMGKVHFYHLKKTCLYFYSNSLIPRYVMITVKSIACGHGRDAISGKNVNKLILLPT